MIGCPTVMFDAKKLAWQTMQLIRKRQDMRLWFKRLECVTALMVSRKCWLTTGPTRAFYKTNLMMLVISGSFSRGGRVELAAKYLVLLLLRRKWIY